MSYTNYERNYSPLITDAGTQRWFMLRQSVPIGYKMLVIKNNEVTETYEHGMKWTSSIPLWHKGGVRVILIDTRDRFEELLFDNELYTQDQNLIHMTFIVHYRVMNFDRIALNVQDPIGQLLNRTKAKLVDQTIKTTLDTFITKGTSVYLEDLHPLKIDLMTIGLDLIRAEVINFKLPEKARDKYAKVMGESREMQMEIDRLKTMKDKGVINDYMKLKLIEGMSNSSFPPMQMYAMQMLGGNMMGNPMPQVLAQPAMGAPQAPSQVGRGLPLVDQPTGIKPASDIMDEKGTILKRVEIPKPALVNLDTGKVFPLEKSLVQIGRGGDNDLVLADDYASRKHAQIVMSEGGELILINLSSNNPIMVNGSNSIDSGERLMLNNNDLIEIGYSKFKVRIPE